MKLSIIAAMASNRSIGLDNQLPWYLPRDLRRFKDLTMGHHLIMGRKTYESVGKPLPGRTTIVLSRSPNTSAEGVIWTNSIEEAIFAAGQDDEAFIAGGAEIYRIFLTLADRMYLTLIHQEFPGDTYFPEFDESNWDLTEREDFEPDDRNAYGHSFLTYDRRPSAGNS